MNRDGLVKEVVTILNATGYEVTKADASNFIDAFINGVVAGIESDGEVRLNGFGKFKVYPVAPRTYLSPQGQKIFKDRHYALRFKPYMEVLLDE